MVDAYVGKLVKVDLSNGLYYKGIVLTFEEDHMTLTDIKNKLIYINLKNIISIREVD